MIFRRTTFNELCEIWLAEGPHMRRKLAQYMMDNGVIDFHWYDGNFRDRESFILMLNMTTINDDEEQERNEKTRFASKVVLDIRDVIRELRNQLSDSNPQMLHDFLSKVVVEIRTGELRITVATPESVLTDVLE